MSTAPRNKDRDRDRDRELSEILQEAQLLRADVVQRAQAEAKKLGEPLWRLILREGLLTDDQLFRVLKQYVRAPVLAEEHLENVVVPPELREALKPQLAQRLGVLPLERSTDGRRAALAMIDPTIDIAPLWPALTPLGVVEVRRFLLNLSTLRRGMQMFYGQSYEAQTADTALDGPTPPPSRSAITQPILRPVSDAPSVMVDPGLQAEIEQLSGSMPIPELSDSDTGPTEAPAAAASSRPMVPSSLLTTMPSIRPSSEPSRPPGSAPVRPAEATPASRPSSGPDAASSGPISIEIDLPDLLQPVMSAASQSTPSLRELSGRHGQPGRPGYAVTPTPEAVRSPLPLGRFGPPATPAAEPPPPARRSPTAPPLLASAAAPSAASFPPEAARPVAAARAPSAPSVPVPAPTSSAASLPNEVPRTPPPARRSPTAPPVLPASAAPSASSVPPEVSRTQPPGRRSTTLPPLLPSAESSRSGRATTIPPVLPSSVSAPSRPGLATRGESAAPPAASSGGRTPSPSAPARPVAKTPAPSSQSPLQELTAADMVVDDDRAGLRLDRSALRVPAAASEAAPAVAQDVVQDALLTTCEALAAAVESQLRTTWPTTLARLCQGVGDQLGFAPRAVRELMLVARLRGIVRAELLAQGPLPPQRPTLLGYPTSSPLLGAARELQKVLVDFMRLPQDEDEPLGMRIVATCAQALELRDKGLSDEELVVKLREQLGDTDVVFQVHKALALNPPPPPEAAPTAPVSAAPALASTSPSADRPPTASRPALWPLPPRMPTVPWTTWRVAELSDEGFQPYQPEEA